VKAALLLASAVALAACRPAPPTTTTSSTTVVSNSSTPVRDYAVDKDGRQSISIDGVRIEIAPDLPERTSYATVPAKGDNQTIVVLRGWSIRIREGRVHVGERDYGPVASGDTVVVAKGGVRVGSELRGTLP